MAMTDKTAPGVSSEIVDVEAICSVEELCLACNVDAEWIAELVGHGTIEPFGQTRSEWQFASLSVVRVAKAKRLERDLELNAAGVALVLDLLDEIDALRSRLGAAERTATMPEVR